VRLTVIAAGFDRYEGERRADAPLGLRAEDDAFGSSESEDLDDDDFDVPEFLR